MPDDLGKAVKKSFSTPTCLPLAEKLPATRMPVCAKALPVVIARAHSAPVSLKRVEGFILCSRGWNSGVDFGGVLGDGAGSGDPQCVAPGQDVFKRAPQMLEA